MAYLVFAVVLSLVGVLVVVRRHRQPTSLDAGIREFSRSLQALAPEPPRPEPRDDGTARHRR